MQYSAKQIEHCMERHVYHIVQLLLFLNVDEFGPKELGPEDRKKSFRYFMVNDLVKPRVLGLMNANIKLSKIAELLKSVQARAVEKIA